jgi:hypothetical protein
MTDEHWKDEPEEQDFPGAQSYLTLLVGLDPATKLRKKLKKQHSLSYFAAKDILRAAGLALLAADEPEVVADLKRSSAGTSCLPYFSYTATRCGLLMGITAFAPAMT